MMEWKFIFAFFIGFSAFFIPYLLFKKGASASVFFSLLIFLLFLFIFDARWTLRFARSFVPRPVLLIDKSDSCDFQLLRQSVEKIKKILPSPRIFYFADSLTHSPRKLNTYATALYDSYLQLTNEVQGKVFIISDFNDNDSLLSLRFSNIVAILTPKRSDSPSFYDIPLPEELAANDMIKLPLKIFSPKASRIRLVVKEKGKVIFSKNFSLKGGINRLDLSIKPEGKSVEDFRFVILRKGKILHQASRFSLIRGAKKKVLFISGRPSFDTAFFNRFLHSLRYIKVRTRVLKKKGENFSFPNLKLLQQYDLVILFEVSDTRLKNIMRLQKYKSAILLVPGRQNMSKLAQALNFKFPKRVKARPVSFTFLDHDYNAMSVFQSNASFLKVNGRITVFLAYDQWKWDFINLPLNLNENKYESLWRNTLISLFDKGKQEGVPVRLNYNEGEITPLGVLTNGLYSFVTNKQKLTFRVHPSLKEAVRMPNETVARGAGNTVVRLKDIQNWKRFLAQNTGNFQIKSFQSFDIRFSKNPIVFLLMMIFLFLFWILGDKASEEI